MFDKYAEHLRDSQPDNSRFDGFDRGDLGRYDPCDSYMTYTPEQEAALDAWVIAYRKAEAARPALDPIHDPIYVQFEDDDIPF